MKVKTLTDDNILYKQGLHTLQNSNHKQFFGRSESMLPWNSWNLKHLYNCFPTKTTENIARYKEVQTKTKKTKKNTDCSVGNIC